MTSNHRPDIGHVIVDAQGHRHPWCLDGKPASEYDPTAHYDMPSLVWVKDGEEWWEDDDEPYDVGHHECRLCGESIRPPFTADDVTRYIAGMRHGSIDGVEVTKEVFERELIREKDAMDQQRRLT